MTNFNTLNQLATAYKNGDESVFNELYMTAYEYCVSEAKKKLEKNPGAETDAEDIAASVAHHVLINKLGSMTNTSGFKTYLKNSVGNRCTDLFRTAYFKNVQTTYQTFKDEDGEEKFFIDTAEDTTSNFNPERKLEEYESRQNFYEVLNNLPEDQRDAFWCVYEEEMTYKETAKHLGENFSTITGRVSQARAKLKKSLKEK